MPPLIDSLALCWFARMELCFQTHAAGEQPGIRNGYGFHIIDDGKHGMKLLIY